MNLDFARMCGKHSAIYEAYYKQIDPKGSGAIEAMTAAKFLKRSGLSDVVLSRVWDLSDPSGKGFLDKPGFFVALKLVSLAQSGQVINMSNIYVETPNPPKVGDLPKIMPQRIPPGPVPMSGGGGGVAAAQPASGDWTIGVIDRLKYEQLFESLKPVGGMLPGNKVKGVLMDSKLPMEMLGKIWDLADQDKDGNLDKHEFIVAMHLVYQTLDKRTVPNVLPPELRKPGGAPPPKPTIGPITVAPTATGHVGMPRAPSGEGFADGGFVANFPKDIAPPPAMPPLPVAVPPMTRIPPVGSAAQPTALINVGGGNSDPLIPIGAPPSVTANADWVVTPAEQKRFEVLFRDSDRDKDGLVSGLEVKNIFLQSGVPQNCLAHIWALCDTNQSGKLTVEQFALAMWMVERKQKGIEPPQVLTANMVPPSMRSLVSGVDVQQQQEPKPTYSNPELEMISKEIEELARERRAMETEIAQKEADVRIKAGEVRSLQSELDTLSATLKQLENQRGEAQKRLDDLKAQSMECQTLLENLNVDIYQTRNQVNKIREQCQKQEDTINEQEGELNAKRSELQKLKDEEAALQKEYDENNRELQRLTLHLTNTQLQISSVRSMVTQLMETQRQMTDALLLCRAAIETQDGEIVSEYLLKIEPDFDDARKTLEKKIEEPAKADPFADQANTAAKKTSNGFVSSNGFESDPFSGPTAATALAGGGAGAAPLRSGFDDSFSATSGFDSGFDAFGGSNIGGSAFGQQQRDPFGGDAFGASKNNAITPEPGKDDFGSDPFASLHAPTGQGQVLSPNAQKSGPPPRPESPSPALPPKKSKVPPPRPAPPRPVQGPPRPAQPTMDSFGSTSTSGGGGFADFADFDNKISDIPPPPTWLARPSQSPFTAFGGSNNISAGAALFDSGDMNSQTTTTTTTGANTTTSSISPAAGFFASSSTTSTLSSTSSVSLGGSNTNSNANTNTNSIAAPGQATRPPPAPPTSTAPVPALPSPSSFSATLDIDPLGKSNNLTTTTTTSNTLAPSQTPTTNQAASIVMASPSAAIAAAFSNAGATTTSASSASKAVISGPTDFSDDPFKDYRYEDPFSIKDPFDDDADTDLAAADPSKVFKDELSSDDETVKITTTTTTENKQSVATTATLQKPNKSASSLSMEFLHQFDAFNVNPSPAPSSTSSGTLPHHVQSATLGGLGSRSSSSNNKSEGNTPVPLGSAIGLFDHHFDNNFDNFADFDGFSMKSTSTGGSASAFEVITNTNNNNNIITATAINDSNNTSKSPINDQSKVALGKSTNDSFFDAFEDDFNSNSTLDTSTSNSIATTKASGGATKEFLDGFGNAKQATIDNAKDAFGASITTTSKTTTTTAEIKRTANLFEAFNDNDFEDDFFKAHQAAEASVAVVATAGKDINLNLHSTNTNAKTTKNSSSSAPIASVDDFAKFDAFGALAGDFDGDDFKIALNNSINTIGGGATSTSAAGSGLATKMNITKVQNQTMLSKMPNVEAATALGGAENGSGGGTLKKTDKFTADYSQPDSFDDDLQEALKRSMIDQ